APLHNSLYQLAVGVDSPIQSYHDLAGRTVSVGAAGSSHDVSARQLFEVLGIVPGRIVNAPNTEISGQFRDGRLDAIFIASSAPFPALAEIDAVHSIRIVPIVESDMELVTEAHPFLGRG